MKFKVERNFLVKTDEFIELDPKDFLHCADISELNDEIEDYISSKCEHPTHPNMIYSEELGCRYYDFYWNSKNEESFYSKWQELKGLPKQLF